MSIEGRIISKVGNEVHIKQFFTGYVYRCDSSKVKMRGTPSNPEKTDDGYFIGKIFWLDGTLVHY